MVQEACNEARCCLRNLTLRPTRTRLTRRSAVPLPFLGRHPGWRSRVADPSGRPRRRSRCSLPPARLFALHPPTKRLPAAPGTAGQRRTGPSGGRWPSGGSGGFRRSSASLRSPPAALRGRRESPSFRPPAPIQSPSRVGHPAPKRGRAVPFNSFYPVGPAPLSLRRSRVRPAG